jgi:hypothetical protein
MKNPSTVHAKPTTARVSRLAAGAATVAINLFYEPSLVAQQLRRI